MLFTCLPPHTKCEWLGIEPFVRRFNVESGTQYSRSRCLDVGDSSKPQPELLLESPGAPPMVVERKSVVWPKTNLADHSKFHRLANAISAELAPHCQDLLMVLELHEASLKPLNKAQVDEAAQAISLRVRHTVGSWSDGFSLSSREPIPWTFRAADRYEAEEAPHQAGIRVLLIIRSDLSESDDPLKARDSALRGLSEELALQLQRAARKLRDYPRAMRVVLLQFFSDTQLVLDDDLVAMVSATDLPPGIDAVWCAYHEWTSESTFEIGWKKVV